MKKQILSFLALGLGFSSMAQIVYTDINDVTLTASTVREQYAVNFDNNSSNEINIFAVDTTIEVTGQLGTQQVPTVAIALEFMNGSKVVGIVDNSSGAGEVLKVDTVQQGTAIDGSSAYVDMSSGSNLLFPGAGLGLHMSVLGNVLDAGDFMNTTDKYIGVKFMMGASEYFGWIRVDVANQAGSVTIKDFAYESTAGNAINAGDTGGANTAVVENSLVDANVYLYATTLNVLNVEGNYNLNIVDLLGKSVCNKNINGNSSIDLNELNNGVYLVQIRKGANVITKKIYVQK